MLAMQAGLRQACLLEDSFEACLWYRFCLNVLDAGCVMLGFSGLWLYASCVMQAGLLVTGRMLFL